MGWETRDRGGRYYTRSRRVDGRIVREYVGCGRVAELTAALDAEDREQRLLEAQARRTEREQLEEDDRLLEQLCRATEALASLVLLNAGFRRHHRGEWRKRRG